MKQPRNHPFEARPIAGYERRVHASAFTRVVETIMIFDDVDATEATRRAMGEIEAGKLRLKVVCGHAAYQVVA